MNGWTLIGVSTCAAGGAQEVSGAVTASGTITVNSATQVTLSIANTGTVASGGCFVIGPLEDTGLTALDTAIQAYPTCAAGLLPGGVILFSAAHFITAPANCRPLGTDTSAWGQGMDIHGQGQGITILIPVAPLTGCTGGFSSHACLNGVLSSHWHDLAIFGMNNSLNANSANEYFFELNSFSRLDHVFFSGLGAACTFQQCIGVEFAGSQSAGTIIADSTIDGFGNPLVSLATQGIVYIFNSIVQDYYQRGIDIPGGGTGQGMNLIMRNSLVASGIGSHNNNVGLWCNSTSSTAPANIWSSGNTFYANGSTSTASVYVVNNANCVYDMDGDWMGDGTAPNTDFISFDNNGGTAVATNHTIFLGGASTGFDVSNALSGSKFIYDNSVVFGSNRLNSVAGTSMVADGHSINGACTGTVGAAATLGLYGTGPNVTVTTCAAPPVGSGIPMTGPRTLNNLVVTVGTGGTNASSGVVTVLKNGGATTITCTLGTGTFCQDGLHSVSVVAGDLISIQFTTQAADTLANVKAFAAWQ
jgi:hypothetical protein